MADGASQLKNYPVCIHLVGSDFVAFTPLVMCRQLSIEKSTHPVEGAIGVSHQA